ncbi:hypothetical protein SSX86_023826 [Deinandra increscens subsp. villosa]|uniref:Uncharacterized protein n=1 Tax=Deinandra increscens subsp. villosa TaxID=3103831 RepID=A0AAP0CM12_9ASTR
MDPPPLDTFPTTSHLESSPSVKDDNDVSLGAKKIVHPRLKLPYDPSVIIPPDFVVPVFPIYTPPFSHSNADPSYDSHVTVVINKHNQNQNENAPFIPKDITKNPDSSHVDEHFANIHPQKSTRESGMVVPSKWRHGPVRKSGRRKNLDSFECEGMDTDDTKNAISFWTYKNLKLRERLELKFGGFGLGKFKEFSKVVDDGSQQFRSLDLSVLVSEVQSNLENLSKEQSNVLTSLARLQHSFPDSTEFKSLHERYQAILNCRRTHSEQLSPDHVSLHEENTEHESDGDEECNDSQSGDSSTDDEIQHDADDGIGDVWDHEITDSQVLDVPTPPGKTQGFHNLIFRAAENHIVPHGDGKKSGPETIHDHLFTPPQIQEEQSLNHDVAEGKTHDGVVDAPTEGNTTPQPLLGNPHTDPPIRDIVPFGNSQSSVHGVDMVFFPVEDSDSYYVLVFELKHPSISAIDSFSTKRPLVNLVDSDDYYQKDSAYKMKHLFCNYLQSIQHPKAANIMSSKIQRCKINWATTGYGVDNGVFLMSHMEKFFGRNEVFQCEFGSHGKTKKGQLNKLRNKYASTILLSKVNLLVEKIKSYLSV